jgi:methyl-accepting chemotaxis protein
VQSIAEGDLTYRFSQHGNETGIYLAMREMVSKLNEMLTQISESTTQVSRTSQDLTTITASSKTGAEHQSDQSNTKLCLSLAVKGRKRKN